MNEIQTIADLVESFGGPSKMAAAIRDLGGGNVNGRTVTLWKVRKRVAWRHHGPIIKAAKKMRIKITADELASLNETAHEDHKVPA